MDCYLGYNLMPTWAIISSQKPLSDECCQPSVGPKPRKASKHWQGFRHWLTYRDRNIWPAEYTEMLNISTSDSASLVCVQVSLDHIHQYKNPTYESLFLNENIILHLRSLSDFCCTAWTTAVSNNILFIFYSKMQIKKCLETEQLFPPPNSRVMANKHLQFPAQTP